MNLNPIAGAAEAIGNTVEKVAGVFTTNAEKDAQRSSAEQMELLKAYQAEFNARENRTWVDAVADAFNRLVRPFIVAIVVFIFIIAYFSPEHFAEITLALSSIPDGYWALLSMIVAFYFGGRMQLKSQDFKFKASQAQAVKALIETKKEFRKLEMDTDEPDKLAGDTEAKAEKLVHQREGQKNRVIDAFLRAPDDKKDAALAASVNKMQNEPEDDILSDFDDDEW